MRGALIPMKDLHGAKGRLADALGADQRAALAAAMFRDVVQACRASGLFDVIAVVSRDSEVFWQARELGAVAIAEPATLNGLNDSLRFGQRYLARRVGVDELLILPADIPLVTPEALRAVCDALGGASRAVAIAPARDGGTNALAIRPAEAIGMRFGVDSARAHAAAARSAGIEPAEVLVPALAFDVDAPEHLAELAREQCGSATHAWFDEWRTGQN